MGGKGQVTVWKGLALSRGGCGSKEDSEERAVQDARGGKSSNSSTTNSNIKSQIKVSRFGRQLYWVWMG